MIAKNAEKMKKKNKKKGSSPSLLEKYANMSTKTLAEGQDNASENKKMSIRDKANLSNMSAERNAEKNYKPGGIAEKADLVRRYNENSK